MSARNQIQQFFQQKADRPLKLSELYQHFDIAQDQRKHFKKVLQELEKAGEIYCNKRGYYGIPQKFGLFRGRIERNPRGFAFLLPDDPQIEDVFITSENLQGAMHNDKVLVRPLPDSKGKRRAGEVVRILERANKTIVGELDHYGSYGFVIPDNKRIYKDVFVPSDKFGQAHSEDKVVVRITRWPERDRSPEGKIIEVIGSKGDKGLDLEAMIRRLQLPQDFSPEVKDAAARLPAEIPAEEITRREDLRDLPLVTIDGEDAKDFDDAVSIQRLDENRVRLGVHIADVSYYVREGDILDQEAYRRGTSIYLVDRVIPMLPERLSNNLCSLRPREDRLTVTVFIDYQLEPFEKLDYHITPSIINSNYRLTYNEVREMLEHDNKELQEQYADFYPRLETMAELHDNLRSGRHLRGTIDFDMPEVEVVLDEEGVPIELQKRPHGLPEQIIEEFMIAANRVIAEHVYWQEEPFIYRVHDKPDPERIKTFNEFIHNFGYHLKGGHNGEVHPGALQQLLEKVAGTDRENIVESMMLRSLSKAIYSPVNIGHFGLSLDYYCHFTSPIRRYPDLVAHRIIKEIIARGKLSAGRRQELENTLPETADHCSLQERQAMEAERDSVELKKVEYMQQFVGEEFTGIINGVTGFGFFVQLENTAEGLVHVEDLTDDYYQYREDQQILIGERTKNIYRLGDKVEVKLVRASVEERKLDFIVVDD